MFSKIFRTMHSIVDCFDAIELCQLNLISEKIMNYNSMHFMSSHFLYLINCNYSNPFQDSLVIYAI